MAKQEISIEQLKTGMFVTALDVSWFKTPFFKHEMLIESDSQILAIKDCGAKTITIDTERGAQPAGDHKESNGEAPPVSNTVVEQTSLRAELETAKQLREASRKMIRNVFSLAKDGGTLRAEMMLPFVDKTLESLSRNSQALITLFFSKRPSSKLYTHAFNMMSMSLLFAQHLGYSTADKERVGLSALLMDIGWLQLPENLFSLPGAYTDHEFSLIQPHVDYSLQLLEKGDFDPEVYRIIAQHHERYDGSGYPSELKGEQIHPVSRILSLVDHFDSLTNGYYDHQPVIPARALQAIYKKSLLPSHEPSLVKTLIRLVGVFPPSSAVLLNTGERGMVTRVNWKAPTAPKVKILYNKACMPLLRPFEVDLANQGAESTVREIRSVIDPTAPGEDPAGLLLNHD